MLNTDDLSKLKSRTRYEILTTILKNGSISRVQLAQTLQLSKSTISENIASLINSGVVLETGVSSSSSVGGRRRVLLQINGNYKYMVVAELGLHSPIFALANMRGEILFRKTLYIPNNAPYTVRLRLCKELIRELIRESNIPAKLLSIIALSSPGAFNISANKFQLNPEFENWNVNQLTSDLENIFSTKVFVVNDVNAATVGEFAKGVSQKTNHSAFLSVGMGVGVGMILDGKLYQGHSGSSGEIARMKILGQPLQLRSLVEINDLLTRTQKNAPSSTYKKIGCAPEDITFASIIKLWKMKDPFVLECIDNIAVALGKVLSMVISLLNCEIAVIGGDYLVFNEQMLPIINKIVQTEAFDPVKVVPSALGQDAGIIGLLSLATDALLEDIALEREPIQ